MGRCLGCPWLCRKPLALWKTSVLAAGCLVNDRASAGRANFVCPRRYEKAEPPVLGGSAIKPFDRGHPLLASLPFEHAVEGAPG